MIVTLDARRRLSFPWPCRRPTQPSTSTLFDAEGGAVVFSSLAIPEGATLSNDWNINVVLSWHEELKTTAPQ